MFVFTLYLRYYTSPNNYAYICKRTRHLIHTVYTSGIQPWVREYTLGGT
jgi:hypothetical protein